MRTVFFDYREVNSMSFRARGALWIFAVHPSPANGHFKNWSEERTGKQTAKCRAVRPAIGQTSVSPPAVVSASLIAAIYRNNIRSPSRLIPNDNGGWQCLASPAGSRSMP
jgi:hypothetical protein